MPVYPALLRQDNAFGTGLLEDDRMIPHTGLSGFGTNSNSAARGLDPSQQLSSLFDRNHGRMGVVQDS